MYSSKVLVALAVLAIAVPTTFLAYQAGVFNPIINQLCPQGCPAPYIGNYGHFVVTPSDGTGCYQIQYYSFTAAGTKEVAKYIAGCGVGTFNVTPQFKAFSFTFSAQKPGLAPYYLVDLYQDFPATRTSMGLIVAKYDSSTSGGSSFQAQAVIVQFA